MNVKRSKKIAILIIMLLFGIGYLYLFFQKGIYFEGVFIPEGKSIDGSIFTGMAFDQDIQISVKGNMEIEKGATIHFLIGNMINETYQVKEQYNQKYSRREAMVYDGEKLLYTGHYQQEDKLYELDENGEYNIFGSQGSYWNQTKFSPSYHIYYEDIVHTAYKDNISIRGNIPGFMMGVIILILVGIDFKWPLFFFTLKHFMSVENPEPTEYYLITQKIAWVVGLIIAFVFLMKGLLDGI